MTLAGTKATNASRTAAERYNTRVSEIRATHDPGTRAYADAMSEACRVYQDACIAAIGPTAAARLGCTVTARRAPRTK